MHIEYVLVACVAILVALLLAAISMFIQSKNIDNKQPLTLLKFFRREEYARQFVAGSIRLGSLSSYRNMESNPRQDQGEGNAAFSVDKDDLQSVVLGQDGSILRQETTSGEMFYQTANANPIYILSCADHRYVDIEVLKEKFGPFVVRIHEPELFREQIENHLRTLDAESPIVNRPAELIKVSYDKGQKRESEPNNAERYTISYSQKPESFSEECEYRYVVISCKPISRDDGPEYITLELGQKLKYLELME